MSVLELVLNPTLFLNSFRTHIGLRTDPGPIPLLETDTELILVQKLIPKPYPNGPRTVSPEPIMVMEQTLNF